MPKCDFNKVAIRHGYSPVNLLHIFRTPFTKNTSGRPLLSFECFSLKHSTAFVKIYEMIGDQKSQYFLWGKSKPRVDKGFI